tara:strand:+ start:1366 stop:2157 length:792 start_codon:yes stop_codon:yes gene_type:complete
MNLKKIVNNYKYFDNINNKNKEIFDIMDTYQGKEQKRFLKLIKALPILFILLPFIPTFLILASPVINVFIYFGTLICLILFTFIFAHLKFKKTNIIKNKNKIIDYMFNDKFIIAPKKIQKINDILSEKFNEEEMDDIIYFQKHKNNFVHDLIIKNHKREIENPYKKLYTELFDEIYLKTKKEDVLIYIFNHSSIYDIESIDKTDLENFISNLENEYKIQIIDILNNKLLEKEKLLKEEESKNKDKVLDKLYQNKNKNKILKEI